jgi:hypothetical protein
MHTLLDELELMGISKLRFATDGDSNGVGDVLGRRSNESVSPAGERVQS